MSRDGGKGFARMAGMLGGGAGAGDLAKLKALGGGGKPPSAEELEQLASKLQGPGGLGGGLKLPGLGGGLPPGFNPFKK